jgi:hypothetical protein
VRSVIIPKLEHGRHRVGEFRSKPGDMHGAFTVIGPFGRDLLIMSSGTGAMAEGWEHVSVSTSSRTPSWAEMCFVKDLFWRDDEVVMQLHPAKSDYVNHHPYCLHLWAPLDASIPLPPSEFVGPKT